jgi:very-short-patch-repair endonuclease
VRVVADRSQHAPVGGLADRIRAAATSASALRSAMSKLQKAAEKLSRRNLTPRAKMRRQFVILSETAASNVRVFLGLCWV